MFSRALLKSVRHFEVGRWSFCTFRAMCQVKKEASASFVPNFLRHQNHATLNERVNICASVRTFSSKSSDTATSFHIQNRDDFNARVLRAKIPIIVDFHAEWCGPCKQLGPSLEREVASRDQKVMLAKVDVDDHGDIAMEYKIMAVPTVMLFKDGKSVDSFQGNIDDDLIKKFVQDAADS
ncbi:putative thioredoxin-2 [Clavelina lepadiformis]|uniref:putative thioredoxin-2 n=1 Tax=Clavelina lepadiformis TaxID=159417 RepID=UPI004042DB92